MRLFTRYILREVISHALLGGALFTFVLFMKDLGTILELVVRNSASLWEIGRIFAYMLPNALTVTVPMAVLVGILLGLSRLAADSEITAMRACGMGAWDFVRIVSIVSIAALTFGIVNSVYFAPRSAAGLLALEGSLKSSQASFEVQPRVFYEDFKNYVLYVQNVTPATGAAIWHHVFLADLTEPATPHITTADQALVVNGDDQTLRMHLMNGGQHQISANDPNQYDVSTFSTMNLPIQTGAQDDTHVSRVDTPLHALTLPELWQRSYASGAVKSKARPYAIELNTRFSYPFACLVLMLVGVPLGLSSKRGGKSTGFVVTILLVLTYYVLSLVGVAFAKSGTLYPVVGVWGANLLFGIAGILLLQQLSRGGIALSIFSSMGQALSRRVLSLFHKGEGDDEGMRTPATVAAFVRRTFRIRFPLLLDDYVMGEYAKNFGLVLSALIMLFIVFTFFELIGDMIRNRTPLITVGDYLLNLIPFILSQVTPLCSLVAVLITFGALNKSSELIAMKSSGISIYRIVTPVLVLAAIISVSLFAFDEFYLPGANRRQEAIRSVIKGKPAQTFLRPDRKWISGQTTTNGEPTRIFYYQYFDADKNSFANLTVFEFDPATFSLTRRIFAGSAHWDDAVHRWIFENGWQRTFTGETTATFQPFTLNTFPEIREAPAYFKKESLQSQEMSYTQLSRYIDDLRQSGFDTKRLSVQLDRKIAYPLITVIMAILAVPFALSMGKRGGLAGIATAIGLAITYWVVDGLFSAMGNTNTLPALLAAWSPDLLFAMAGSYLLLRTQT
ncbi:LptF/LptG family permease [Granulicella arctica]|uniref:LptF/LptG family permease n=1 Tax=Granulicella arctica TaxID=940613 RepID=UPI0021E0587C|nr:LptF/LptG family permease [Granulicella arctica]